MATKNPSKLEIHIGRRLRALRKERGLSLMQVGEIVGVTPQQASRLERAENQLTANHIYSFARAFGVPVAWFYQGYEEEPEELERIRTVLNEYQADWVPATAKELDEVLLAAWHGLPSKIQQQRVLAMLEGFAFEV